MLFKKKQEALDDQFTVYQEREVPRFAAGGAMTIEGFEGEGRLKNVCVSGCCLESVTYAAITPGNSYKLTIIPGGNITLEPFTARVTASWTKSSEMLFEAGFALEKNSKSRQLEQYVEQLQVHGVQPEYGNMKHNRGK